MDKVTVSVVIARLVLFVLRVDRESAIKFGLLGGRLHHQDLAPGACCNMTSLLVPSCENLFADLRKFACKWLLVNENREVFDMTGFFKNLFGH